MAIMRIKFLCLMYSCMLDTCTTEEDMDMSILNIHEEMVSPPGTPDIIDKDGGRRGDSDQDSLRKSRSVSSSSKSSNTSYPKVTTANKSLRASRMCRTVNYEL